MRDYLTLGSSPYDENCVQVGVQEYAKLARIECKRYIKLLLKKFGIPPARTYVKVKSFSHDFGTYHEVVVEYDCKDEVGLQYAIHCENNMPATWDDTEEVRFVPDLSVEQMR